MAKRLIVEAWTMGGNPACQAVEIKVDCGPGAKPERMLMASVEVNPETGEAILHVTNRDGNLVWTDRVK